ncbi:MAG: metallophosphoesterase family protein [Sedimentisphaerales bacterium]|nr:metallophosphoesterase family protein [Sedimentisphaerales bacterium]
MTLVEKVGVLVFLGVIAIVFLTESKILVKGLICLIRRQKPMRQVLLTRRAVLFHCLALGGVICFLYGYFIEPYWIEVNTIQLDSPKLKNASLRIVHFSDTHCDHKLRNEDKLVQMVNNLSPDIIVFTGDALNAVEALYRFQERLRTMKAHLGKYAVRGNIECCYYPAVDLFRGTGFQRLNGNSVRITKDGDAFVIAGMDCPGMGTLPSPPDGLSADDFNILLYHAPDLAETIDTTIFDLYLAGHTHGGQVALPWYGALTTLSRYGKKYESGLYHLGLDRTDNDSQTIASKETILYINRGIGMENDPAPRVRFCARPEITVYDIRPATAKESASKRK